MTNVRPTVYDVAERAGVSIATVSFAFRKPDKVADKTRSAVLQAARDLGYLPSGSARSLAHGSTGVLGLHLFDRPTGRMDAPPMPDTFPIFDDEVQHGFIAECREQGVGALLSSGGSALAEVIDTAGRVDGLAVLPTRTAQETLATVSATIPVVRISSRGGHGHHISVDNAAGVALLVEHLVRVHDVSSFAWVGPDDMDDFVDRKAALSQTVVELLGTPVSVLDTDAIDSDLRFASVLAAARSGMLPDAIICASDIFALALIGELVDAGLTVPGDVRVVGFDGLLAGRLSSPTLTTIQQPMELIGRTAARLLLDRQSVGDPESIVLPVTLVIGESCGCGASSRTG